MDGRSGPHDLSGRFPMKVSHDARLLGSATKLTESRMSLQSGLDTDGFHPAAGSSTHRASLAFGPPR
jgi:hypothetical protein